MEAAECDFLRSRGLSVKMEWEGQAIGFPARRGKLRLRQAGPLRGCTRYRRQHRAHRPEIGDVCD